MNIDYNDFNMKKNIKRKHILDKSEKLIIFLSISGLFPFFVGLLDLWINKNNFLFPINLPKYYGSIILTFLGAVYWGSILSSSKTSYVSRQIKIFVIIWSIIPSFLGIIVLSIKNNFSILLLTFGFLFCQFIDEIFNKFLLFPNWYLYLRRFLTLTVIFILICSYLTIEYF